MIVADTTQIHVALTGGQRQTENVEALSSLSELQRFWIRLGIVVGLTCLVIAGGTLYRNWPHVREMLLHWAGRDKPVYQWVESDVRTFDFLPGEGKGWGPITPQQGEIRYNIAASLPVDTGLMDDANWINRADGWGAMRTSSSCYEAGIRKATKQCHLTSGRPQLIFLRDQRAKQAGLNWDNIFGTKGPLQEPNSVTVTILTLKCVEHCEYALK